MPVSRLPGLDLNLKGDDTQEKPGAEASPSTQKKPFEKHLPHLVPRVLEA